MRFYRSENSDEVVKIYPWLIPTDDQTRLDIAAELAYRLDKNPEDTYVLVAIENGITRAVLIAYKLSKRIVWIWQAQSEAGFRYSAFMMKALIAWARSRGAKNIGAGVSEKHKEFFKRRWGFRELRNGELRRRLK